MKKAFILLFSATLILSACKKDDDNDPGIPDKPFSYLETGHRWVYDFKYNNTIVDSLTVEVTAENNGVYTIVVKDKTVTDTVYYYAEGGYVKTYRRGQTKAQAVRVAKQNPHDGDMWTDFDGRDNIHYTVKNVNKPLTVPAGTFTCTEIESYYENSGTTTTTYSNNEISWVKMIIPSTQGTAVYELRYKNF